MRLCFAGTEYNAFAKVARDNGSKNMLQSAFYLNYKREPNVMRSEFYLLDSGGFTARKQGTPIDVKKYSDYINKFDVKLAFNLDTMDVKETLDNQKYLEKNTKAYIIPVYHFSEFINPKHKGLLKEYAKEYPYIGLGGTAEGATSVTNNKLAFFDFCFHTVGIKNKIHGLAVTSNTLMKRYPFYSVDSTSWLSSLSFGKFMQFKDGEFISFNSVNVDGKLSNPGQLMDKEGRLKYAVKAFVGVEKDITAFWKMRGVVWDDKI